MLFITEPLVSLKKKKDCIRPRKAIDCVQGKYSVNSPLTPGGLEKLKMKSGYVRKGDIVGHRRSTGRDTLAGSLSLNNQRGNIMVVVLVMMKREN
jgi:hypothetical protein